MQIQIPTSIVVSGMQESGKTQWIKNQLLPRIQGYYDELTIYSPVLKIINHYNESDWFANEKTSFESVNDDDIINVISEILHSRQETPNQTQKVIILEDYTLKVLKFVSSVFKMAQSLNISIVVVSQEAHKSYKIWDTCEHSVFFSQVFMKSMVKVLRQYAQKGDKQLESKVFKALTIPFNYIYATKGKPISFGVANV